MKMLNSKNIKIILFFIGATIFYFLDYFLFKKTPLNLNIVTDYLGTEFPLFSLIASLLKRGIFPLWNPYIFCGNPLFASGFSVINIFNLPALFLKSLTAYVLSLVLQLFCAGIFMFYYLNKGLNLTKNASFLGAVIFMFNPLFLTTLPHVFGDPSIVLWVPLVLLFYELSFQRRNIIYALLCGLILSVSFYTGTGYLYLYSCLFLLLYAAYRIYKGSDNKKYIPYHFIRLGILLLVSLLLSAARILPMVELAQLSQRGPEHLAEGLWISNLIGIFLPFGSVQIGQAEIGTLNYAYFYYAGTATIFLVLAAFLYLRKKHFTGLFLWSLLILVSSLILLRYTPIKLYLSRINFLLGTLGLERFNFYYHIIVGAIAALTYDALEKKSIKPPLLFNIVKCVRIVIFFYAVLLIALVLAWIGKDFLKPKILQVFQIVFSNLLLGRLAYQHNISYYLEKFSYLYEQFFHLSFLSLVFIAISARLFSLIFLSRLCRGRMRYSFILVCLVAIDLIFVTKIFSKPFTDDYYFIYDFTSKEMSFLKTIKPTERMGIKINYYTRDFNRPDFKLDYTNQIADLGPHKLGLNYDVPIVFEASTPGGLDGLHLKRYNEFVDLIHKDDPNYPLRQQTQIYRSVVEFTSINSRLVDLLGMKYIFSVSKLSDAKLKFLFQGKDYYVYENFNVLPRSFLVGKIKIAADKKEIFDLLSDPKFNPAQEAILEGPFMHTLDKSEDKSRSADIVFYQPNKVIIETSDNHDSLLVLTDAYYPGWKAFIDGKETKIYITDYIFRSIYFPKGRHRVEFVYDPFSLKLGLVISVVTLLILIFIFISKLINITQTVMKI
ncbi:MAG: YfhO family protein [Candidatus Omnitrophica bacterium]|nr:YfhO family protein [Candidatus Omnitrophota bacterium]